jgi:2-dehydro-3-deoxyphosphooctonate aldolase (KDO 8-P synthase)
MSSDLTTSVRSFPIGDVTIGDGGLVWILGPCVLESEEMALRVADRLAQVVQQTGQAIVFKSSYAKANRLRADSYSGLGLDVGLRILQKIRGDTGLPVTTDIHLPSEAAPVAEVVDLVQIPAFLCRQTDLVVAAARTGKPINIKKGQFLNPADMAHIADKAVQAGNDRVVLTERGTSHGYGDLIVDFRSLPIMRGFGYPVCYDASHATQTPGSSGGRSGGRREFLLPLLRAALAVGVDAVFCEVHPDPPQAKSDAQTQWPLDRLHDLWEAADRYATESYLHPGSAGG